MHPLTSCIKNIESKVDTQVKRACITELSVLSTAPTRMGETRYVMTWGSGCSTKFKTIHANN